jgi:hypothetical protein
MLDTWVDRWTKKWRQQDEHVEWKVDTEYNMYEEYLESK